MSRNIPRKVQEYYDSYRILFIRTRKEAGFFRTTSKWVDLLSKLTTPLFIPFFPAILWILSTDAKIIIQPWPVNIIELYFISWWISLIIIGSVFLAITNLTFYFYYQKRRFEIVRRRKYPFCLLKEASAEISSYLVNKDEIRLSKAIDYLYDYTVLERASDLIVMRPLGEGSISIGTNRRAHSALTLILQEKPWIKVSNSSVEIAESLDFFYNEIVDLLEDILDGKDFDLISLVKAIDFLAIHEYLKINYKEEDFKEKYIEGTYLKKFASIIKSIQKTEPIDELIDIEEEEERKYFGSLFSGSMFRSENLYVKVIKYFAFSFITIFTLLLITLKVLDIELQATNVGQVILAASTFTVALALRAHVKEKKADVFTSLEREEEE